MSSAVRAGNVTIFERKPPVPRPGAQQRFAWRNGGTRAVAGPVRLVGAAPNQQCRVRSDAGRATLGPGTLSESTRQMCRTCPFVEESE